MPTRRQSQRIKKPTKKKFEKELQRLQLELVRLQEWVRHSGERVAFIFEGRYAAGKDGVKCRISDPQKS